MKITIYGAGAIGGHIAARLAKNGADVSIIARGAQLEAVQARGLTIQAPDETFTTHPRASASPAELGPQDAVLVTVKAPALPAVAAAIAPLLGPDTKVAFILNGIPWWYGDGLEGPLANLRLPMVDPDDTVRTAIPPARTIGGVVYSSCTVIAPGTIQVANPKSTLILGTPTGDTPPALTALAAALDQPAYACTLTPRIRDAVWTKLFTNLGSGPFAVLGLAAPEAGFRDPIIEQAARTIFAEAMTLATTLGATPRFNEAAALQSLREMTHRPSILQDLQLGRPMEIDGIYSSTLHLARLAGVEMPTLSMLVALMKVRARGAGLYSGQ